MTTNQWWARSGSNTASPASAAIQSVGCCPGCTGHRPHHFAVCPGLSAASDPGTEGVPEHGCQGTAGQCVRRRAPHIPPVRSVSRYPAGMAFRSRPSEPHRKASLTSARSLPITTRGRPPATIAASFDMDCEPCIEDTSAGAGTPTHKKPPAAPRASSSLAGRRAAQQISSARHASDNKGVGSPASVHTAARPHGHRHAHTHGRRPASTARPAARSGAGSTPSCRRPVRAPRRAAARFARTTAAGCSRWPRCTTAASRPRQTQGEP